MPGINKLAATKVARISKPGRYGDGAGLWLQVAKAGSKSWIFQFTSQGRERQLGLGSLATVSLADARKKAKAARDLVAEGVDPIEAKQAQRQQAIVADAKRVTFEEAAEGYMAAHGPSWRNEKHRAQWASTLKTYAYPTIGKVALPDIDTPMILKLLKPIWTTKPETAGRVRGRIENILDAAKAEGNRTGDNPARWKGHLDHLLPALTKIKAVKHHAAMPYGDMAKFMASLKMRTGISVRALEVLILTASRTGALIGMRDEEVDFAERVWTVPASRMKTGKEHLVPLSDRTIAILKSVEREKGNPHFFAGLSKGSHISNMAMLALMKHVAPDYVPHGFRSTFTDWANETTATPHHVVEMALAHSIQSKTERAYRRGTLFEKRRELMNAWSAYLYPEKKPK
ncbi:integrase [Tardiphaga robiniae]|uniref:tyrosine-type recombinase/integrase n=1 Tax=Tardiphaga robiniae TaxID=943830 RepID=UPI002863F8D4|nr:integrase arm-type DNA-binding domain-containing protein [Tardiphaga robiniae]MDR6657792.1 integrase [Tardiphaga robiniae]